VASQGKCWPWGSGNFVGLGGRSGESLLSADDQLCGLGQMTTKSQLFSS
jgi:hypothetical protein